MEDRDDPWTQAPPVHVANNDCKFPINYKLDPQSGRLVNNQSKSYRNVFTGKETDQDQLRTDRKLDGGKNYPAADISWEKNNKALRNCNVHPNESAS